MRPISLLILAPGLFCLGIAGADAQAKDPILERVAEKVVQKYQSGRRTCHEVSNNH